MGVVVVVVVAGGGVAVRSAHAVKIPHCDDAADLFG